MELIKCQCMQKHLSIKCIYHKGMIIYYEHDVCDRLGVIISGQVRLVHYTNDGEERVLANLKSGDIFGDVLIHSSMPFYPGHLIASIKTEIAFIDMNKLDELLGKNQDFRICYLKQLSEKALNYNLHNKLLMQKSLREKIMMWLSYQRQDKVKIESKEQLANFFNVQRPSLSRELGLMKREGLVDYDRHYIYLKQ